MSKVLPEESVTYGLAEHSKSTPLVNPGTKKLMTHGPAEFSESTPLFDGAFGAADKTPDPELGRTLQDLELHGSVPGRVDTVEDFEPEPSPAETDPDPQDEPDAIFQTLTARHVEVEDADVYTYFPDELPFHFRFDVACALFGATCGDYQLLDLADNARSIRLKLEEEWRQARIMQEQEWRDRRCVSYEVMRCVRSLRADWQDRIFALERQLGRTCDCARNCTCPWDDAAPFESRRRTLQDCVRILSLEKIPGTPVTAEDLEQGGTYLHMIVDVSGDPLLHDVGWEAERTVFKVWTVVYHRRLAASCDNAAPTHQLRLARLSGLDFVFLFPTRPYPECRLARPMEGFDVGDAFPVESELARARDLKVKAVAARATLTHLFWDCFDMMFDQFPRSEQSTKSKLALPWRVDSHMFHSRSKIVSADRDHALQMLWNVIPPTKFKMPFDCYIDAAELEGKELLDAIQIAVSRSAKKYNASLDAHTQGARLRVKVKSPFDDEYDEDRLVHVVEPPVAVGTELAVVKYIAVTFDSNGSSESVSSYDENQDADMSDPTKCVSVVIDVSRWREGRGLRAMHLCEGDHWEVAQALMFVRELERFMQTAAHLPDMQAKAVIDKLSQLAYGLHALQRAVMKAQLRSVGLSVMESERPRLAEEARQKLSLCSLACRLFRAQISGTELGTSRVQRRRSSLASVDQVDQLTGRISLTLTIVGASGLRCADVGSSSDPYCVCEIKDKPFTATRTSVVKKCLDPTWNHEAEFTDCAVGDVLEFSVWDSDLMKADDLLGKASIRLERDGFEGDVKLEGGGVLTVRIEPGSLSNVDDAQRIFLITAPDHVLEQRAELQGFRAVVKPGKNGKYVGGFVPAQFDRDGPMQDFWVQTHINPYPYRGYFASALPMTDPLSVLSPSLRKYLVRALIADPKSDVRLPDGTTCPCGAEMDPQELKIEGILEDFMPIGSTLVADSLVKKWALPWKDVGWTVATMNGLRFLMAGWCIFLRSVLTVCLCGRRFQCFTGLRPKNAAIINVNIHFGPQVASYFCFLEYYVKALIFPAFLGGWAWWAGDPQIRREYQLWKYCQPCFGLFLPIWGVFLCAGWRRHMTRTAYSWHNGMVQVGSEVQSSSVSSIFSRTSQSVRPEFAMAFRRKLATQTPARQRKTLKSIKRILRLHRLEAPEYNNVLLAFNDKTLRQELDYFNNACFNSEAVRRRRNIAAVLVTLGFVLLAASIAVTNLNIQEHIAGTTKATLRSDLSREQFLSYVASGFVSSMTIPVLSKLHKWAAAATTAWQELRTDEEQDTWVFVKLFSFEFFNQTFPVFWIAFKRRDMQLLRTHLFILIAVQVIWGNMKELGLPLLMQYLAKLQQLKAGEAVVRRKRSTGSLGFIYTGVAMGGVFGRSLRQVGNQAARSETFQIFDEVIEIIVQYGTAIMFGMAFPMGVVFALIASLIELRVDAYKLLRLVRFPEPRMSVGIGMPFYAMVAITYIALFNNTALLFVTEYPLEDGGTVRAIELLLPGMEAYDRVLSAVVLEHIVMICMYLVFWWPPVTQDVMEEQYRQMYFENREERVYQLAETGDETVQAIMAENNRKLSSSLRHRRVKVATGEPVSSETDDFPQTFAAEDGHVDP